MVNNVNKFGFLLINKPPGPTSHDIIDELREITNIRKIGHAGTLDPFASGLLIVAVGREATRQISEFVKLDKKYVARLRLGYVSDTYDRTGVIKDIVNRVNKMVNKVNNLKHPKLSEIKSALQGFLGEQLQVPPMFSAKKVKGKKLYELARAGKEVEREPVKINIYELSLIKYDYPYLTIDAHCSSGTYIRTIAHDIGQRLGIGAYLKELKRTQIGEYELRNAVELKGLTKENFSQFLFLL
ncbi:tRNA pseudouridine(55) synthase TruB [Patescibacteria group bacterium]|nr:tRNA pseudouridine(55) synthase TruB [Patescibacteria group bacterium]MBU4512730.1 tRNA pseudouridine(55) synthase TruB [Patescibacteria group bacterium]MCG2693399.1 tRNA pseudouridine(55) synthase TruB [Candidatus Parcubacteria bacterium]